MVDDAGLIFDGDPRKTAKAGAAAVAAPSGADTLPATEGAS